MKKIWIILITALLLVASVGTAIAAEPEKTTEETVVFTPNEALVQEAKQLYKNCLRSSYRSTFSGYCGLMTSYQLYKLGINPELDIYDGKDQYDAYKKLEVTEKGHTVRAYDAQDYSLEEALNAVCANGKKTVRNILVGFQWTATSAGSKYGHCLVINAIEGGMIYYTESFSGALEVPEGQVIVCTVKEFSDYYTKWTRFEGLVYFGEPEYANSCVSYKTDVYLQLRFDSTLRSQPSLYDENGCQSMRTIDGGEVLHATGLFQSKDGDLFYRVYDSDTVGYVSVNAVFLLKTAAEPVTVSNLNIPETLSAGKKLTVSGTMSVKSAAINAITLKLVDKDGKESLSIRKEISDGRRDLSLFNQQLKNKSLAEGCYSLIILAETTSAVAEHGVVTEIAVEQELHRQLLTVGQAEASDTTENTEVCSGWFEKNDTWYCYKDGVPCTGWITRVGVKYYLNEEGAVTTGWATIDGNKYYFTATGALCQGWVTIYEGVYYWYEDGTLAVGMQTIDGATYYFNEEGLLVTWGTVTWGGAQYTIGADGVATVNA